MGFADDDEEVATGKRRRRRRRPFLQGTGIRSGIEQRFRSRTILSRTARNRRRRIFRRPRTFRRFCGVLHARRPGTLILLSRRFRFVISLKQKKMKYIFKGKFNLLPEGTAHEKKSQASSLRNLSIKNKSRPGKTRLGEVRKRC